MGGESSTGGGGAASAGDGSTGNSAGLGGDNATAAASTTANTPAPTINSESNPGNPLNQSHESGKTFSNGQLNITNNAENTQGKTQAERGEAKIPDSQPQRNVEMDAAELNVVRQPDRSISETPGNDKNPGDKRSNMVEMPETTIRATPNKRAEAEQPVIANSNSKNHSTYTSFDQSLSGIPNNTKVQNSTAKSNGNRATETINGNDSLIVYPNSLPNFQRPSWAPPSISDDTIEPGVRIPFKASPSTPPKSKKTRKKAKINLRKPVSGLAQVFGPGGYAGKSESIYLGGLNAKKVSPEKVKSVVKEIVYFLQYDSELESRIYGNFYEHYLALLPWGQYTGANRNLTFIMINIFVPFYDPYDPSEPENARLVCTGISEAVVEGIKRNPQMAKTLKPDTVSRNIVADHTAVKINIEGEEIVLDYHKTLDINNPMVFKYSDWAKGDDDKGVSFENIKNNTFSGQMFLYPK